MLAIDYLALNKVCLHNGVSMKQGPVKGFTLIELLTVIAIVGILAGFAINSMQDYVQRSRYSELVVASEPFRKSVDLCYQLNNSVNNCAAGQNGVPQNYSSMSGAVAYIFVLSGGQIYVFPNDVNGFSLISDYYTLTPTVINSQLKWSYDGPGAKYI